MDYIIFKLNFTRNREEREREREREDGKRISFSLSLFFPWLFLCNGYYEEIG